MFWKKWLGRRMVNSMPDPMTASSTGTF